jgi:histidyl-tRNA synthetase
VVGPDERNRGEVVLRDLGTGSQEAVPQDTLEDTIKSRMHA